VLIEQKRNKYDVSNNIRKLLEASLKEICQALEVKLPFRFNDKNERRMSGELLCELRATVNKKCPPLKGHASFANLEGSNLVVTADEGSSWDALHATYEMKRINHEEAYSLDGACTNCAEEFFSRMRRAEQGHHHHIAGAIFTSLRARGFMARRPSPD
jgi:hypothetical protein